MNGHPTIQMFTSYWGNPKLKHLPQNQEWYIVQISTSCPKELKFNNGKGIMTIYEVFQEVMPEWRIVEKVKQDHDEGYYYAEYMKKIFAHKDAIAKRIVDIYHNAQKQNKERKIVFCCYEKPQDFCHRHIFATFCNKMFSNLNITELQ